MRRVELRNVTVLSLTDAEPPPAGWCYAFPGPAAEAGQETRKRWAGDGQFHTRFTVHAFVRSGLVTLVDAGLGPGPSGYFAGLRGRLDQGLAEAGLTPSMVDCVMFTHFHLDHVGWASHGGVPCFPNARYLAPAAELAHWRLHGAAAALPHHTAAFEQHVAPLLVLGLLDGFEDGRLAPGAVPLAYRSVPGHTPGHAAVVFSEGGERAVIAGDAWHSPAQIERPDWCHRADRDPAAAVRARIGLAQWALDTRALVAAGHFPEAWGFGHVVARGDTGTTWQKLG